MSKEKQTENKTDAPLKAPTLKVGVSTHYEAIWLKKEAVELRTGKNDFEYYVLTLDGVEVMVNTKAFINESKDGTKLGFHIQNSREYRIMGTSESVKGKDLIQFIIKTNMFNKQQNAK